jgi:hypothetical protein
MHLYKWVGLDTSDLSELFSCRKQGSSCVNANWPSVDPPIYLQSNIKIPYEPKSFCKNVSDLPIPKIKANSADIIQIQYQLINSIAP